MSNRKREDPEIEWADYARIEPGRYVAYCRSAKQYLDRRFKRHTLLLHFDIFDQSQQFVGNLPMWLNLGSGQKPRAGRGSNFFSEWIKANGGPPSRGDRLSDRVFTKRMATVEVEDTKGEAPYSVVRRIVEWQTGKLAAFTGQSVKESSSQGRHTGTALDSGDYEEALSAF